MRTPERADARNSRPDARFALTAAVPLLALLMALLLETIVNVGVDSFATGSAVSLTIVPWVTGGYLLAVSIAAPASGWAIDRLGGRATWLTAVVLEAFTIRGGAALLAALSSVGLPGPIHSGASIEDRHIQPAPQGQA